jgi:hypothetical protein
MLSLAYLPDDSIERRVGVYDSPGVTHEVEFLLAEFVHGDDRVREAVSCVRLGVVVRCREAYVARKLGRDTSLSLYHVIMLAACPRPIDMWSGPLHVIECELRGE